MKSDIKYDLSPLNNMVKSLNDKYQVRVGIFGNKNARQAGAKTNAAIGALHEYGSVEQHIPARSFLRMPLALKGNQVVKEAAPFAAQHIAKGKVVLFLQKIGVACQNVIDQAFVSRGFGQWAANAPATIRRKKGRDTVLIDTSQLRRSITSKVVKL